MRAANLTIAATLMLGGCAADTTQRAEAVADERDALRSTVRIRATLCEGLSTGSGLITTEGTVVTNLHVIEDAKHITVTTWDGHDHRASVAATAPGYDIAMLEIPTLDRSGTLPIPTSPINVAPGDRIALAGHHNAGPLTLRRGRITGTTTATGHTGEVLRTDIAVRPGGSGGPAIHLDTGELIGLVFAYDENSGDGLIIPSEHLEALRSDRREAATCTRPQT